MMSVVLALYSCIHDEVYSSADPSSTEYTNKTLWKQDEKYIKNVMAVYLENEKDIRKSNGVPFWDYATTINTFDESFLMVPVVENKKVVSVLQVPRRGNKVHFYYSRIGEQISFFQGLIFAKHKKAVFSENTYANKAIICTTQIMAIWLPNDESDPDPESGNGHWGTRTVRVCKEEKELCAGIVNEFGQCEGSGSGEDDDDPGYEYPGEDQEEPTQLPDPKDTCEKLKAQTSNAVYKSKVDFLKGKTNESFEYGFRVGNPMPGTNQVGAQYQQLNNTVGSKTLNFKIFNNTVGFMHSHYEGLIPIFSPDDINNFIKMLINAANNGIPLDTVYMTLINPDGTTYQLWGSNNIDVSNLAIFPQSTVDNMLNKIYTGTDYELDKANQSPQFYQENFLKFMKEYMNIEGAKMYSVDDSGKGSQLSLNGNSLAPPIPCSN